jgi:hypothetical protein
MSYSRIAKAVQRLASASSNGFYVWHHQENRRLGNESVFLAPHGIGLVLTEFVLKCSVKPRQNWLDRGALE